MKMYECTYDDEDGACRLNFPCQGYGDTLVAPMVVWLYGCMVVFARMYICRKVLIEYIEEVHGTVSVSNAKNAKQMPNTNLGTTRR